MAGASESPAPEPGCVFCAVAAGATPADVVLDEPDLLAFLDRAPVFPGHVLVIPRRHHETLTDLPVELVETLFTAVRRVCAAVEGALAAHGTFMAVNNRVSQSVPHLHVHVVPRRFKDGLRGFFWPRQKYGGDAERAEVAHRIRSALRPPDESA